MPTRVKGTGRRHQTQLAARWAQFCWSPGGHASNPALNKAAGRAWVGSAGEGWGGWGGPGRAGEGRGGLGRAGEGWEGVGLGWTNALWVTMLQLHLVQNQVAGIRK